MQVACPALYRQVRMQVITSWTGGQADALRQALRMTNESFAEYLGVAARTVAYWRKNPEITPTPKIQETLDAALDRATDRAKAQFAVLTGEAEHGKRPDQVESFELPGGALLGVSPGVNPEFGDSEYLQSIRRHIREIVALDNRFGGADLVRLSTRFFRTLHEQLGTGTYDLNLERDLQSAAAELAEVVGWLAYDAEAHDLARRMNQESLYFARLAGDKTIELLTLQNSSMHAASQGRPKEALQIARSVLEGDYRLSPRLKALFLTRKARALAQGGGDSALRLLPEIRSLYHEGVSDEDPAWAWWIDERELAWHEAMVQRDLGMPERAIAQFERSVIATPPTEIRSQYLHRAYLLQAQADNATWDDAEQSIRQLLPLSTEVASTRTVVLLRKVTGQLAAHPRVPSALQEQVTTLNAALDQAPV
jgi:transcriptional regulator with XRE-family HTH domain